MSKPSLLSEFFPLLLLFSWFLYTGGNPQHNSDWTNGGNVQYPITSVSGIPYTSGYGLYPYQNNFPPGVVTEPSSKVYSIITTTIETWDPEEVVVTKEKNLIVPKPVVVTSVEEIEKPVVSTIVEKPATKSKTTTVEKIETVIFNKPTLNVEQKVTKLDKVHAKPEHEEFEYVYEEYEVDDPSSKDR